MQTSRRWRLTWWLAGEPSKSRSKWYSHHCKLCAYKQAYSLGCAMADLSKVGRENVRWSVGVYKEHLAAPEIVMTSDRQPLGQLKSHAHG